MFKISLYYANESDLLAIIGFIHIFDLIEDKFDEDLFNRYVTKPISQSWIDLDIEFKHLQFLHSQTKINWEFGEHWKLYHDPFEEV